MEGRKERERMEKQSWGTERERERETLCQNESRYVKENMTLQHVSSSVLMTPDYTVIDCNLESRGGVLTLSVPASITSVRSPAGNAGELLLLSGKSLSLSSPEIRLAYCSDRCFSTAAAGKGPVDVSIVNYTCNLSPGGILNLCYNQNHWNVLKADCRQDAV